MRALPVAILFAFGALVLMSCATTPRPQNLWVRTDGQSTRDTPALASQFEVDRTICEGEMQKANLSGAQYCRGLADCIVSGAARGDAMATVGKGCMAQHGYILMPEDQVEGYRATMLATAAPAPAPAPHGAKAKK